MSKHREAFKQFLDRLEPETGDKIVQVVLFGSVARNEENKDSDVDALVIVEDKSVKDSVFDASFDTMLETDIYISPKVLTQSEFEKVKKTSFIDEIESEMQVYG